MDIIGDKIYLAPDEAAVSAGVPQEFSVGEVRDKLNVLSAFTKQLEAYAQSLEESSSGMDRETATIYADRAARMRGVSEKLVQELTPEEINFRQYIGRGIAQAETYANYADPK